MKNNIYEDVLQYAVKHNIADSITFVTDETVDNVLEKLSRYQIVCITQQRFRDLKLGQGNSGNYLFFKPESIDNKEDINVEAKSQSVKRIIIIDEMPIFYDSSLWDITSENNSFDWYENLAGKTDMSTKDFKEGRDILSELINKELKENTSLTYNLKLKRFIEGSEKEILFNSILEKLTDVKGDLHDLRRYKWFVRLYHYDKVGSIGKDNKHLLICSEWFDYRDFDTSILILDGTVHRTNNETVF